MAEKAAFNIRKILLGVCLCAAAGMGQFILSGSSQVQEIESHGSREATITLTKTKRLTQTPAPRFTLTTTVILPTYEWMEATENVLFPWCGPENRRFYSDSGDWVASRCINRSMGVYNAKDLRKKFYFTFREVYGSKYENGNGDGQIVPIHFSHDEEYYYFTVYHPGDGGCGNYADYMALFKLNLTTGEITEQVTPEEKNYYNFSFSSDDKFLAYFTSNLGNPNLYLQDLNNNEKKMISINDVYSDAGFMVWSPDNDQLIFAARSGEDCFDMDYYVVSINLNNFKQKVIIQEKNLAIIPVRWVDFEHILVEANSTKEHSDTKYSILNINSGRLEPVSHPEAIPTGPAD